MEKEKWLENLQGKVPEKALSYCFSLWEEEPFIFEITKSRRSKLGDFRYRKDKSIQKITINNDLNQYQFLITFIHEVAHHRVFSRYKERIGKGILPHGIEWKQSFKWLMAPMLHEGVFPNDILIPLRLYMNNPKASTGADLFLMKELRKYDKNTFIKEEPLLGDLAINTHFLLRKRQFKKLRTQRTRVLCQELATGRNYLISGHAVVKEIDNPEDLPF
ncbi:SprT-like domain-containing protein [Cyclobacterium sediminis]